LNALYPLLATVAAYLIGSLSFAVIVSRAMGLNDPRTYGSGNPGATNVLRSGSKAAAAVTLLLDAAKGWLPVALVQWFGSRFGLGDGTVAGTWRHEGERVRLEPFDRLPRAVRRELDEEAERLAAFHAD